MCSGIVARVTWGREAGGREIAREARRDRERGHPARSARHPAGHIAVSSLWAVGRPARDTPLGPRHDAGDDGQDARAPLPFVFLTRLLFRWLLRPLLWATMMS